MKRNILYDFRAILIFFHVLFVMKSFFIFSVISGGFVFAYEFLSKKMAFSFQIIKDEIRGLDKKHYFYIHK